MFRNKDYHWIILGIATVVLCGVLGFAVEQAGSLKPEARRAWQADNQAVIGRRKLQQIYTSQIAVREATGRNDGADVEKYLKYIGLPKGYSYCAAFVCWSLGKAGMGNPKNGWAPALFPARRVIWDRGLRIKRQGLRIKRQELRVKSQELRGKGQESSGKNPVDPEQGDVFGLYFSELKRIAHCGFVDKWDNKWCITVEPNTNDIGSVPFVDDPANPIRAGPGEGVYRKKRLIKTIYKVSNWID